MTSSPTHLTNTFTLFPTVFSKLQHLSASFLLINAERIQTNRKSTSLCLGSYAILFCTSVYLPSCCRIRSLFHDENSWENHSRSLGLSEREREQAVSQAVLIILPSISYSSCSEGRSTLQWPAFCFIFSISIYPYECRLWNVKYITITILVRDLSFFFLFK